LAAFTVRGRNRVCRATFSTPGVPAYPAAETRTRLAHHYILPRAAPSPTAAPAFHLLALPRISQAAGTTMMLIPVGGIVRFAYRDATAA